LFQFLLCLRFGFRFRTRQSRLLPISRFLGPNHCQDLGILRYRPAFLRVLFVQLLAQFAEPLPAGRRIEFPIAFPLVAKGIP